MVNYKFNAVIDSGTMITFSTTCLMNVFRSFVEKNKIKLYVSEDIERESVLKPLSNKRFALSASRIKYLFNSDTIEVVNTNFSIEKVQAKIMDLSNNCFYTEKGSIKIIQVGEAEALALALENNAKAIFVDERTTRSLIEDPYRLKQKLEKKQKERVKIDRKKFNEFKEMFSELKVFRSVDIIALAFEQDLFKGELDNGKKELESALYAIKYAGCAVSSNEIGDYLKKYSSSKKNN